jgi:hypothetical protein
MEGIMFLRAIALISLISGSVTAQNYPCIRISNIPANAQALATGSTMLNAQIDANQSNHVDSANAAAGIQIGDESGVVQMLVQGSTLLNPVGSTCQGQCVCQSLSQATRFDPYIGATANFVGPPDSTAFANEQTYQIGNDCHLGSDRVPVWLQGTVTIQGVVSSQGSDAVGANSTSGFQIQGPGINGWVLLASTQGVSQVTGQITYTDFDGQIIVDNINELNGGFNRTYAVRVPASKCDQFTVNCNAAAFSQVLVNPGGDSGLAGGNINGTFVYTAVPR